MGTETRYLNVADIVSEQELFSRWAAMQAEDERLRGEDPYNGALTRAYLRVSNKVFKTYNEATTFAENQYLAKGEAVAYKYGEKPGFPKTKADVELVARIASMQKERDSFYTDILKRFVESKSSSKKCTHCDSVISKKSRIGYVSLQTKLAKSRDRFYDDEGTCCPACGGNLLVTDTDKKRLEALTKRHREAVDKRDKLLAAAKKSSPAWGYYIVAAVPS